MYKLLISSKAGRRLKMLKKEHQLAVVEALEEISEDPYVGKPLTRELTGRFSYRVGVNRIIYRINEPDKSVQVVTAGHRSNVYPPSQKITSVSLRMNAKNFLLRRDFTPDEAQGETPDRKVLGVS